MAYFLSSGKDALDIQFSGIFWIMGLCGWFQRGNTVGQQASSDTKATCALCASRSMHLLKNMDGANVWLFRKRTCDYQRHWHLLRGTTSRPIGNVAYFRLRGAHLSTLLHIMHLSYSLHLFPKCLGQWKAGGGSY